MNGLTPNSQQVPIDDLDLRLIAAAQSGLPLVPRPYHAIAEQIGIPAEEVMARLARMQETGAVRRIGLVPNHYALGYRANGMSVWDVADDRVDELGEQIGRLVFVSHCYRRPRHPPQWPYNLFAMLHGKSREEVTAYAEEIRALLGDACRASDILYSQGILKKTGLRIAT